MNRKTLITLLTFICSLFVIHAVMAQSGGQVCIRSFEDRNTNGVLDAGEPLLTRGISANLINDAGITIQTALLDDSSRAAQGIMCFQFLEAGQYTISLASADYNPTASNAFPANVTATSIEIFDFGASLAISEAPLTAEELSQQATQARQGQISAAQVGRIFIAAAGGAIAFGVFTVLGVLIYAIFIRPRGVERMPPGYRPGDTGAYYPVTDTGSYRPVGDTGPYYPQPTGDTGPYRPPTGDTGPYYPPRPQGDTGPYYPPRQTGDTGQYRPPTSDTGPYNPPQE